VSGRLQGTVAIVAVDALDLARRLAAEGATVVLFGSASEETGHLVAELEGGPGRVAVFTGGLEGLTDFVAELFA
jgi:hypothetical protein